MKTRANLNNFLVMLVFLLATLCTAAAGGTIYVDAGAPGPTHDGTSWANAYKYLQDALAGASSGDEIWVAQGTYKPDEDNSNPTGTGNRNATFQLISGVAIYGGFLGDETSLDQRDWQAHETILSGDLNGDDGSDFANNGENSRRVVTGSGTDGTAVLDGFTIMGGYADILSGAGMYNYGGSPTVTNCTFSGNSAARGGGMFNWNYSSPTLSNCTFSENSGSTGGGMANWDFSIPTLTNCTFSGNSGYRGGGICNSRSSPTLANCTFSDNSATDGGGIQSWNSSPTLTNCMFSGNSGQFGGGMHNLGSSPTLTNCTFTGNSAESGAGMYSRGDSNPMLTECEFAENVASDYAGGMYIDYGSPTVTNCTFSRNSARAGGGMANNVNSNTTVTNCTFSGNSARDNGGGMVNRYSSPTVTNCTFSGNLADSGGGGMHNLGSSPTVTNCKFRGNSAIYSGGGMDNNVNCNTTMTNCAFSGNSAHFGGGMCNLHNSSPMVTNCTFSGNSATMYGGGVYNSYNSSPMVTNSILWGDTAGTGPEIYNDGTSSPTVTYCDVQGGCSGTGNIALDPLFADADLRLSAGSPCINVGSNNALPPDTADLDGDGDTTEPIPLDLDGNPRILNGVVDMGAYEGEGQGPSIITVEIDIKPGSFPNSINLGSKGVIPVAILTTDDFDAITVVPETVGFGPGDALPVHWALEDVDGNGYTDLILHFKTQKTGIEAGDTEATLIGGTVDSIPIEGTDSVRIVPPEGKSKGKK